MKTENILVLGLGGVGYYLAKRLSRDGHAVTAIESNPDLIRRADAELDARVVQGDAMSFASWQEAAAAEIDTMIAVTDNDSLNILASVIAHRFGITQKIARVRGLELWSEDAPIHPGDLEIDLLIRPEELAAQEIARLLKMRTGGALVPVADGRMQVVAIHVRAKSPLARMLVQDLAAKHADLDFRIACVARDINTIIPSGDFKILPDDHVYIVTHTSDVEQWTKLAGVKEETHHRVLIVGGGMIGTRVAELLERDFPVRIIEKDERRAEELSYSMKRTEVLHGDGTAAATLLEAGLLSVDTVVTATGDNEANIMTSMLAKHLISSRKNGNGAAGKTIALVKREEYLVLASSMGADLAVAKKVLAGNEVLRYIRRRHVLSVAHLHGCDAELVELVPEEGSPITKRPLMQQPDLRGRIVIAAVRRGDGWEIPRGDMHIQPGERVIGICTSDNLRELQALFLA